MMLLLVKSWLGLSRSPITTKTPLSRAAKSAIEHLESRIFLSTTLAPSDDAFTYQYTPGTHFGGEDSVRVRNSTGGHERWSWLKFPISSITSVDQKIQINVNTHPDWKTKTVEHYYSDEADGRMKGEVVEHNTLPWYVYEFVIQDLS